LPESVRTAVGERSWDDLISAASAGELVAPVYQPIVDVRRGVIAGYEALARFTAGPELTPDRWFGAAAELGRVPELDAAVLRAALAQRASLPANTFLSVNIEPESLLDPVVLRLFSAHAPLDGLAIEVTEHREVDHERSVNVLDHLRAMGALIAVDDAGAGYAGLRQILTLRPQILKLDRELVMGVDTDEAKAALIEMLGVFSNRIDAWILAEGVETRAEARRIRSLGVPLAQGFYYAMPAPPFATLATHLYDDDAEDDDDRGLRPLLVAAPSVPEHDTERAGEVFALSDVAHVVVTRDDRPVGMLTPGALLEGNLLRPMQANADTSPAEVAHRIATRVNGDVHLPVIVTDNAGRYLGVVHHVRLISHLAGIDA
jgi:EAL domain-containing protein (putative c-di-GMP-specific phosphodiesterase class I)